MYVLLLYITLHYINLRTYYDCAVMIKLGKSVIHILASQIRKDKNDKSCLNSV